MSDLPSPDPRDRAADPGPWEDEPAYCYDERHEMPCPLPCRACEEECEPPAVSYGPAPAGAHDPDECPVGGLHTWTDEVGPEHEHLRSSQRWHCDECGASAPIKGEPEHDVIVDELPAVSYNSRGVSYGPGLSFEDEARAGLGLPPSWRDPDAGRE